MSQKQGGRNPSFVKNSYPAEEDTGLTGYEHVTGNPNRESGRTKRSKRSFKVKGPNHNSR